MACKQRPARHSAIRNPQSAFTLVELLVVITIIGILVALLLPAVSGAFGTARQTAIALEINIVGQSIEQYKNDLAGGSYPPDIGIGDGAAPAQVRDSIVADFLRHFNKTFPRHREPQELLRALAGVDASGAPLVPTDPAPNLVGGLNPAEALVFYLQRFSSDPQFPISGSGGPSFVVGQQEDLASRNWIGNFEPTRYGMLINGARMSVAEVLALPSVPRSVQYTVNINGANQTRQINFWQYFPPNSPQPLVYFDASRGVHDVNHPSFGAEVHAIKTLRAGATQPFVADIALANIEKFQILHCGLDEEWGEFADAHINLALLTDSINDATQPALNAGGNTPVLFPNGPFTLELADTIINFSDSATLEDSQP